MRRAGRSFCMLVARAGVTKPCSRQISRRMAAWCMDRLIGVEKLGGVGLPLPPALFRMSLFAVQAEPGPPPHSAAAAQGDELAGPRGQLATARRPDGVVRAIGGKGCHAEMQPALHGQYRHLASLCYHVPRCGLRWRANAGHGSLNKPETTPPPDFTTYATPPSPERGKRLWDD